MPETGRSLLESADTAAEAGREDEARSLLRAARFLMQREGDLAGLAAVMRREARTLDEAGRVAALREAVRIAARADDVVGQVEGLEDLSRDHADAGRVGPAMALLGEIVRLQRARRDRAGEVRAVLLGGRLLCEAWGDAKDPGAGLVLLLWAEEAARRIDDSLARMTKTYIEGYSYTLSPAEFAAIEPMFDLDRLAVIDATFARFQHEHPETLP